ncbi:ATP-grasp domain-containing protein [Marinobacter sp. HL-58]|uniref:ATP-grasp domain-containing protein n=1 Tax=Marinobacter sp. HL-58 TaxID=1479237 RepID=UPI0006DAD797|nr:ATP-grasp domain-containing protein [Marinobacter sp. HL-58]KPP98891.1 MAG: Biotin carboxylase [Marinobacter sp. HL-58]
MDQEKPRCKNIFVLCLDDFHRRDLERIPDRDSFRFHGLLTLEELRGKSGQEIDSAIARAEEQLSAFGGPVDAIIGYWDFPVTAIKAILCEKFGLPSPGLEPVLKCAHKYWSRLEQRRHIPELTPGFCAVDPFARDPFEDITLDFPFWIKPVCGYGSMLGFRINNRREFDRAMDITRRKIGYLGDPFNAILARVDTSELGGVDGKHMIAEELLSGIELAPEGYAQDGEVKVHGVVDMVRAPNHKSFKCYRYPSSHLRRIQTRAIDATRKLLLGVGYNNGCFNVEYFWDKDTDEMRIVEVNTRISQSHSNLMFKVDGMSNYEVAIHVGLGDNPQYEHGGGQFKMAAKFLLRRFDTADARCLSAPGEEALARLYQRQPETTVFLRVREGMRLSEAAEQDPYSWILAELVIGGDDIHDLDRKFDEASDLLPFEFEPVTGSESEASHGKVHD